MYMVGWLLLKGNTCFSVEIIWGLVRSFCGIDCIGSCPLWTHRVNGHVNDRDRLGFVFMLRRVSIFWQDWEATPQKRLCTFKHPPSYIILPVLFLIGIVFFSCFFWFFMTVASSFALCICLIFLPESVVSRNVSCFLFVYFLLLSFRLLFEGSVVSLFFYVELPARFFPKTYFSLSLVLRLASSSHSSSPPFLTDSLTHRPSTDVLTLWLASSLLSCLLSLPIVCFACPFFSTTLSYALALFFIHSNLSCFTCVCFVVVFFVVPRDM